MSFFIYKFPNAHDGKSKLQHKGYSIYLENKKTAIPTHILLLNRLNEWTTLDLKKYDRN